jgi:hypothetical protein
VAGAFQHPTAANLSVAEEIPQKMPKTPQWAIATPDGTEKDLNFTQTRVNLACLDKFPGNFDALQPPSRQTSC